MASNRRGGSGPPAAAPQRTTRGKTARPPSRQGKKPVTAYVDKDLHKQLRLLGLELEKSTQDMIVEALHHYFERHRSGRGAGISGRG